MKFKKLKLFVMMSAVAVCCAFAVNPTAKAASSKDYTMAQHSNSKIDSVNNVLYYEISKNGYTVRVKNNVLQSRKGSGSWKTIARPASGRYIDSKIATNGSTVYYCVSNSLNGNTIYSVTVNGNKKTKVLSSSSVIMGVFRYGNKIFYNSWNDMSPHYYNLSTKKRTKMKSGMRIDYAEDKYVVYNGWTTGGGDFPGTMYSYNAETGKTVKLVSKANQYNGELYKGRMYFAECTKDNGYGKPKTYRARSCKLNGTDYKSLSPRTDCYALGNFTRKYMEYYPNSNYKTIYRYTYSTHKTEVVKTK